jgi:hypothetical protein
MGGTASAVSQAKDNYSIANKNNPTPPPTEESEQTLTGEQYFELITDAVEKVEKGSKLDQKDYIKRVLKEALNIR